MDNRYLFDHPILNSPYEYPRRHWELDEAGQPTQQIIETRRGAKFITPIPKPKKRKSRGTDGDLCSTRARGFRPRSSSTIPPRSSTRFAAMWTHGVRCPTPVSGRSRRRPPGCCSTGGITSSAASVRSSARSRRWKPRSGSPRSRRNRPEGKRLLDHLAAANKDANPELMRLALKLATGAGKTTVMAMLIAWQTINAVRRPASKHFTRGFLVCAPGLTIKDRLRVLQPNDPDSYYASRELVPNDMLDDVNRAKIVITNFHAFKLRERVELSKGGRAAPPRARRRGAEHAGNRRPDDPAGDARPDGHEEHPRHQ